MFIDTMSSRELFAEYEADLPEIQDSVLKFGETKYVNDYLLKHKKQARVIFRRQLTTKRGNHYLGIIIFQQIGGGKTKVWDWHSFHVGSMFTYKGIMTLMFFGEQKMAVSYSPHFFSRYKQRMLDVCDDWKLRAKLENTKTNDDIVALYVSRNLGVAWVETTSAYHNKLHIFAPIPDGVALLQWDKSVQRLQANTFITNDMLDERQQIMLDRALNYYNLSAEERKNIKTPTFMYDRDENSSN